MYWWFVRPNTQGVKAVITSQNKILLVRLTYYPNTWTFPGGGVKKKETPLHAAIRECKEEVGIDLQNLIYVGVLSFGHEYKKDTVHVFASEGVSIKQEIISDLIEVAEAKWFSLDALPSIGPNAKKILELYTSNKITF